MILSRRSFLKLAGLTTVAAAGASMFTGCGAFSTTPIKVVAAKDSTKEFQAAVAELNKKKLVVWPADANGAYLNSFLMTNLSANGLSPASLWKRPSIRPLRTQRLVKSTSIWKSPLSPLNNFSKVLFERRAFARLFLFCPLSSKKVPAAVHPVLHRTAAVIYNKEQCKHHPVFCRKDTPSCEFVFIPLAARST